MKRIYTIRMLIDGFFLSLDPYMCIFGVSLEGCFWLMMRVCVGCYCYSTRVSILYIFIDRQCFPAGTTPACANVVVFSRLRSMCFVTNPLTLPNGIPEMSSPRSLLSFPSFRAHPQCYKRGRQKMSGHCKNRDQDRSVTLYCSYQRLHKIQSV